MTKEPLFRPGIEISTWPYLRVARAEQHAHDLVARHVVWAVGAQPAVDVTYSNDRLTAYVKVGVVGAPTNELALCVADCVHNLRASLDGLAWELAHLDGAAPKAEKGIYFPVCETKEAWGRAIQSLETIPPVALERIESLQPYNDTAPNPRLLVLHRLDILQKHHQGIRANHRPQKISLEDAAYTFIDPVEEERAEDVLTVSLVPDSFAPDGSIIVEIASKYPIESMNLPVRLESQLFMNSEFGHVTLPKDLVALVSAVKYVHELVAGVPPTTNQVG